MGGSPFFCGGGAVQLQGAAVVHLNAAGADQLQQARKVANMVLRLLLAAEQLPIFCKRPLSSPRSMWGNTVCNGDKSLARGDQRLKNFPVWFPLAQVLRPIRVEPR